MWSIMWFTANGSYGLKIKLTLLLSPWKSNATEHTSAKTSNVAWKGWPLLRDKTCRLLDEVWWNVHWKSILSSPPSSLLARVSHRGLYSELVLGVGRTACSGMSEHIFTPSWWMKRIINHGLLSETRLWVGIFFLYRHWQGVMMAVPRVLRATHK